MKKLILLSLLSSFFFGTFNVNAQNKETRKEREEKRDERRKAEEIKLAQKNVFSIESLNFSFYPNTIEPEFGVINQLTGGGDFYLTVDKTIMYMNLPYIGNFYINPITPSNNAPINLTSSKFLYFVNTTDKINFQVTIIPTDLTNYLNEGIKFVVSMNKNTGYAKLVVTADNRQEITYTGTFN